MKKIKLLPSVLMLALCIGILGIGIYAATPTNNVITGTITVNAANAGIKVEVWEGESVGAGDPFKSATGRTQTEIDLQNIAIDASNALSLDDVPVKYYTIRFSTTSNLKFVVDTETIQLVNGTITETSETKEDAIIITKNHKKYLEDGTTGLAYFTADTKDGETITADNSYVITIAIKLGELPEQAFIASFDMVFDVYKLEDWVEEGNTGINGIDYLHLGEYPQEKSTETTGFGEKVGEFGAYNDEATKTSEIGTTRDVYSKDGKRYVEMDGSYYEIQPLKWRILDKANGEYKLMCETIIEQVEYQKFCSGEYAVIDGVTSSTIYANNYKESTLRKFMNEIFYESAFGDAECVLIQKTIVKNDDESMGGIDSFECSCEDTEDWIFALSVADATDVGYGFEEDGEIIDRARQIVLSDYAKDTGVSIVGVTGFWLLRSPDPDSTDYARFVFESGEMWGDDVSYDSFGCVPAMVIGL